MPKHSDFYCWFPEKEQVSRQCSPMLICWHEFVCCQHDHNGREQCAAIVIFANLGQFEVWMRNSDFCDGHVNTANPATKRIKPIHARMTGISSMSGISSRIISRLYFMIFSLSIWSVSAPYCAVWVKSRPANSMMPIRESMKIEIVGCPHIAYLTQRRVGRL